MVLSQTRRRWAQKAGRAATRPRGHAKRRRAVRTLLLPKLPHTPMFANSLTDVHAPVWLWKLEAVHGCSFSFCRGGLWYFSSWQGSAREPHASQLQRRKQIAKGTPRPHHLAQNEFGRILHPALVLPSAPHTGREGGVRPKDPNGKLVLCFGKKRVSCALAQLYLHSTAMSLAFIVDLRRRQSAFVG